MLDAIKVGYRHFDTAQSYANEKEVGEAIAESGLPREEFFITSKVWLEHYGYEKTKKAVLHSLEVMGLDYLDLIASFHLALFRLLWFLSCFGRLV